jgi:antitoxin (DNA-binding transcriptional repressor) of toxin-antitoxin stability system
MDYHYQCLRARRKNWGGCSMKFVTIRDLRSKTGAIRKDLEREREIVLTANGRPFAVMTPVGSDTLEEEIHAIRRARAKAAVERIRAQAKMQGLEAPTMAQIDKVIAEARRRRSAK